MARNRHVGTIIRPLGARIGKLDGGNSHAHGVTNIETSSDAAKALQPIAGEFAFVVCCAWHRSDGSACGSSFGRKRGLCARRNASVARSVSRKSAGRAPAFYWAIAAAVLIGLALLNFSPLDPVKALFLERGGQWRRRGPNHGHDHAYGVAAGK